MQQLTNPKSTKLVLLSGWGFTAQAWQPFMNQLPPSYSTQCHQLPTIPATTTQPDTVMTQAARRLADKLPEQAIIIGWSLGGNVAATYSYLYPERCQALITIASSPRYTQALDWPGISWKQSQRLWQLANKDWNRFLSYFSQLNGYPHRDHQLIKRIQAYLLTADTAIQQLQTYLQTLFQLDERQLWQLIAIPRLHVYADQDAIVDPNQAKPFTAANHAHYQSMHQGCHALPLQQPHNLAQHIHQWLTGHA